MYREREIPRRALLRALGDLAEPGDARALAALRGNMCVYAYYVYIYIYIYTQMMHVYKYIYIYIYTFIIYIYIHMEPLV